MPRASAKRMVLKKYLPKHFPSVLFSIILLMSARFAVAEDSMQPLLGAGALGTAQQRVAAAIKPQWQQCAQDADCDYLAYNCTQYVPVNKASRGPANDALCSIGTDVACNWTQCQVLASPMVVCGDAHRCIIKWAAGSRSTPSYRHPGNR